MAQWVAAWAAVVMLPLALAQTTPAPNAANEINAVNGKVMQLYRQGQLKEALELATTNLRRSQTLFGESHARAMAPTDSYATILRALGRDGEALPHYERVLNYYTAEFGGGHPFTINTLAIVTGLLDKLGRVRDALPRHERLLSLQTRALGERHPTTLISLRNYAWALYAAGRAADALPHYERALRLHADVHGDKHAQTIITLNDYAFVLKTVGRVAEALPLAERALALAVEVFGEAHANTLQMRHNYADMLYVSGRPAQALPHHERVLTQRIATQGEQHPGTVQSLTSLAATLEALGRTEEALVHYERALKLGTLVLGEAHPEMLTLQHNYAGALHQSGRSAEALTRLAQALRLSGETRGEIHPATLGLLNSYAVVIHEVKGAEAALPIYERSLKASVDALGEKHSASLLALTNYAAALLDAKQPDEALRHNTRALRGREDVLGESHPHLLYTLGNQARILHQLGQYTLAVQYHERYAAIVEAQRDEAGGDSKESQRGIISRYLLGYHNYLITLHRAGRIGDALRVLERTKARTLLDQMALRSAISDSGLPDAESQRLRELARRMGDLDARIAQSVASAERDQIKSERAATSREFAAQRHSLQTQYPRFRHMSTVQLAGAEDAGALLPPAALFVSYVVTRSAAAKALTLNAAGEARWTDLAVLPGLADTVEALRLWSEMQGVGAVLDGNGKRYEIVRWMDGGKPRWRAITATQPCDERLVRRQDREGDDSITPNSGITTARMPAGNAGADCMPAGATVVSGSEQYQALVNYLGQQLIEPLKEQLAGRTQLIISPDGPLGLLPWDILPLNGQPLIAQFTVSQVQSLSVLKLIRQRQAENAQGAKQQALLAMGNPEYEADDKGDGGHARGTVRVAVRSPQRQGDNPLERLRTLSWSNLPGTQVEMERAARLFPDANRVISGPQASETRLRELSASGELAQYRYLLFSAHGYFDPQLPALSSLVLARDGPEPERDGYVTLSEWAGLRLASELTLLSACNTARAPSISGEGLVGLSYALYVAGNINTVLTLWEVDDNVTPEFITRLFARIKAGEPHAQALTAVKRDFLQHIDPRKRNPYYWAPFVLYGM